MTRPQPIIHVVIVGSRQDHRPTDCPCHPIEATELLGGPLGRIVMVHRDRPEPLPVRRDPETAS
jgi:hypothetical protein